MNNRRSEESPLLQERKPNPYPGFSELSVEELFGFKKGRLVFWLRPMMPNGFGRIVCFCIQMRTNCHYVMIKEELASGKKKVYLVPVMELVLADKSDTSK